MVRAIYERGKVRTIDPVPTNWREGQPLQIEAENDECSIEQMERDFAELNAMNAASDLEDWERMQQALHEAKAIAKAQVRKQMGLE